MKPTEQKVIEWFLRISLSAGMLSAVADRFGLWPKTLSVWGNWENFIAYTQTLNPLVPTSLIGIVGGIATVVELICAIGLLINYRTSAVAKATGALLLLFALAMTFTSSIKAPLDYSVFAASAGAFALSILTKP